MLHVGSLKQDWLGRWKLHHSVTGEELLLGSTTIDFTNNIGIVFGVSGVSKMNIGDVSYYYGMINNPMIKTVVIEVSGKSYDNIPFIEANGDRFFLLKIHGNNVPYSLKALSKTGEVIYEE